MPLIVVVNLFGPTDLNNFLDCLARLGALWLICRRLVSQFGSRALAKKCVFNILVFLICFGVSPGQHLTCTKSVQFGLCSSKEEYRPKWQAIFLNLSLQLSWTRGVEKVFNLFLAHVSKSVEGLAEHMFFNLYMCLIHSMGYLV